MYSFYSGRRKPELVDAATYSLVDFREAESLVEDWKALAAEAERIEGLLDPEYLDAYYELVLFPVLASGNHNELYVTAAQNELCASQGRASANDMAARVGELFNRDQELVARYHGEPGSTCSRSG